MFNCVPRHGGGKKGAHETSQVTVAIVTWNVGNEEPFWGAHAPTLAEFFPDKDIVVVGVQECKYQAGERKTNDDPDEDDLMDEAEAKAELDRPNEIAVRVHSKDNMSHKQPDEPPEEKKLQAKSQSHFSKLLSVEAKKRGYSLVSGDSLKQIRLLMFARHKIASAISGVQIFKEATGILHVYGNKGGLGVTFELYGNRLTFVTAHLAAHLHHVFSRNADVEEILAGTHIFHKRFDLTTTSDHLFWCGDLNYRVDLDYVAGQKPEKIKVGSEKHNQNLETITNAVEKRDFTFLLAHDQLALERQRGAVFAGFQEQQITFQPTFKVKRDRQLTDEQLNANSSDATTTTTTTNTYYNAQRMPSYCDRVLWHSLPGLANHVTATEYTMLPNVGTSDHKPVRACFNVSLVPPPPKHSSTHGPEMILKQLVFSGGDLASREGMYLVISSQPIYLTTPVQTNSMQTPNWSEKPVYVQLHVGDHDHHHKVSVSETFHVLVSLIDDKFGPDETIGSAAINVQQVLLASENNSANGGASGYKFRVPVRRSGVDTMIYMEGIAEVLLHGHKEWKDPKQLKYAKSIKQMV